MGAILCLFTVCGAQAAEYWMYVGTFAGPASKGIYGYRFDAATGKVTSQGLAAETEHPSLLTMHPNGRYLFAAHGRLTMVGSYAVDAATGKLTLINEVPSEGKNPVFVLVDHTGKHLLVANYDSGTLAVLPIGPDGRLGKATATVEHHGKSGVNAERQASPHPHNLALTSDNRFVLVPDLGLDQILVYRFDAAHGTLMPNNPPFAKIAPGSGPRHVAFHPNGKMVYVVSELASTLTAYSFDSATGGLNQVQSISALPPDFKGQSASSEVQVNKAGTVLYASNRGHDSIAAFSIDKHDFKLTLLDAVSSGGKTPRYFCLDPTGKFLVAGDQDSNLVVEFAVDAKTGKLSPATTVATDVGSPVAIVFAPKK